ncbi:MAG: HIT domain-containing protein [Mariprofundaceae bacterium]|nr:HIT domain-containing protein [Mariprofundaceae bacterium]
MILNERLAEDCFIVGHFPLSVLLLMNDARYPWFVLVPQRENISEIQQLYEADRHQLMDESCSLSLALREGFAADRINVAALGNVVSQLHVHHIVRYTSDDAWPLPVWGRFPAVSYSRLAHEEVIRRLLRSLPKQALTGFSAV